MCNEWLDESDLKVFEDMKKNNPRRYRVAGLGEWGISEGLVFENWEEKDFSIDELKGEKCFETVFGLDFGYTNDPTALFCGFINTEKKEIYALPNSNKKIGVPLYWETVFSSTSVNFFVICNCIS